MSLIILVVVLILIVVLCRSFRSFIYAFAISDILLRIIAFISSQVTGSVHQFLEQIPDSIQSMIAADSRGVLYTVLMWVYVALYIVFVSYLIPGFFRRRR